ncbi:N-6 DNA methylase [Dysgonomonas sp. 25]|uniref:N-6 DNA methylase n=1 Tax=Dysgonomonas sp. 25 TaxID=2302933 RepID=UPI0013D4BDAF|nr:N-6 DNA methylase [Dysgonomonas sp. 25]NDV69969.1 DNA methylase [Dysgonomonas sp. 25]
MGYNKKKHLQDNILAIKVLCELRATKLEPTEEQLSTLEKYSGFGGLNCILKPCEKPEDKQTWTKSEQYLFDDTVELYRQIHRYSTDEEEYKNNVSSLKSSILSAFYTPPEITKVIAKVFDICGLQVSRFLDPCCGTGVFSRAFEEYAKEYICFEKDLITARIATYLNPYACIYSEGYETIKPHFNNYFDIVASNIPFGNYKVYDPLFSRDETKQKSCNKIHNYFFLKATDSVREGGIIAFITSQGVMNSQENKPIREWLMNRYNLISAIRLPNNLFIDTEVGSDLIILQKNTAKTKLGNREIAFLDTRTLSNGCTINNYYKGFSRVVHTKLIVDTDGYGKPGFNFYYEDSIENLAEDLFFKLQNDCLAFIDTDLYNNNLHASVPVEEMEEAEDDDTDNAVEINLYDLFGISEEDRSQIKVKQKNRSVDLCVEESDISITTMEDPLKTIRTSKNPCIYKGMMEEFYDKGTLIQYKGQTGILSIQTEIRKGEEIKTNMFNPIEVTHEQSLRIKDYILLRDAYYKLFNYEYEQKYESPHLRKVLNTQYEEFVSKRGNLNSKENYRLITLDALGLDVLALESFENGHKKLADIFTEPVSFRRDNEIKALRADEALASSLNLYGYPHFQHMISVSEKTQEELLSELKGVLYYNPLLFRYELSTHLISGNVLVKSEAIDEYINENPDAPDIEESRESLQVLKDAIPEAIPFADLDFNFGERWIPEKYYNDFCSGLLATKIQINYFVDLDNFNIISDNRDTIEVTEKYAVTPVDSDKLDGLKLLSHALLNTIPKITKGTGQSDINGKEIRVADTEAIQQANTKIDEIRACFVDWLLDLPVNKKEELAALYNRKFNSRVIPKYDGKFQTFPGLQLESLKIPKPYDSQYDTVWMLKSNMGGIVDHEVGSGKTLTICMAAHEMKRLKMVDKPLIIGKKGNIFEIAKTYATVYPNDRILYPSEKDFEKKNRKQLFTKIKNNNWDVIIMTHDQFFKIPQSLDMQFQILQKELDSVEENLKVAERLSGKNASTAMLKGLQKRQENLKAALSLLFEKMEARRDEVVDFKTMGIDHIFIDESHVFKNLRFDTRYRNVAGLGDPKGSQRALNLLYAIRTIQDKFDRDLCTTFLSGTTISNSLVELYLIFKYLRPRAMEAQGIRTFDAWAAVYAKKTSDYEFTVTGEIKSKERFRFFKNVPELAKFYNEITDYRRAEDVNIVRPKNNIILHAVKQTPEQALFQQDLIEFAKTGDGELIGRPGMDYSKARSGKMLVVTDLARKAAIDMRLIDPEKYKDYRGSKIPEAAKKITEYYYKYDEYKGTQFVFSDIGTYKPDKWNVYSELKKILVEEYHLPANEIRFIQEAVTTRQREKMIADFRIGKIRVLIGHTESLGTGVDAPHKCVAIHNISMPWTPKDLDQRGGRGARKGNEIARLYANNVVDNFMYAAEGSLDTYMFNLLQNKQTFITQLKTNSLGTRIIDEGAMDSDGNMNYSEFVAILSGNNDLLEKAKLERKVMALESEHRSYNKQLDMTASRLNYITRELNRDKERLVGIKEDWRIIEEKLPMNDEGIRPNPIRLNNFNYNDDLQAIGERLIEINKYKNTHGYYETIGSLLHFEILVKTEKLDNYSFNRFFIEGACKYSYNSGHLADTPGLAASNFIRALGRIPRLIEKYETDNREKEVDIAKMQEIIDTPWRKESQLKDMKIQLAALERKIKNDLGEIGNSETISSKIEEEIIEVV